MDLKDRTVLITGSSRGIGKATAHLAGREGARVVVNFNKEKGRAEETARQIEKEGGQAIALQADVAKPDQVKEMISQVTAKWGNIDVLINNAGVLNSGHILNQKEEKINQTIDVNIKGLIWVTKEVAPIMVKQGSGVIVNIASGAGKRGHADYSVYSTTKFAVLGFTQSIAQDLKGHNIRVYAVCPGTTATDMTGGRGMPAEKVAKRIIKTAKEELGLSSGEDTEIYH